MASSLRRNDEKLDSLRVSPKSLATRPCKPHRRHPQQGSGVDIVKTEQCLEHKTHVRLGLRRAHGVHRTCGARGASFGHHRRTKVKPRPPRHVRRRHHQPRPRVTIDGAHQQLIHSPRLHPPRRELVQLTRRQLPRLKVSRRLGDKHAQQEPLNLEQPARVERLNKLRMRHGPRDFRHEAVRVCAGVGALG